jgi:hypothetical protein
MIDPDDAVQPGASLGGDAAEHDVASAQPARVLIVAHRTAATPRLLAAVGERARRGPCQFTLLVPKPYWDPDTEEAAMTLELAIPLLERAAGARVEGIVGGSEEPLTAVRQVLEHARFDEVIISTLPARVSRWLHRDLPRRVEQLGRPVTVITAEQAQRALGVSRGDERPESR